MFLPQRSLQMVTFLAIGFFACFATCQDIENKRAVTEHQLMHDKGRAFQGLKRLMWLHNALGSVHTASSRDISLSDAMWDSQKSQDPSDLYSIISRDEMKPDSSLMKQLMELTEKEPGFPALKQLDLLQYVKTPKGTVNLQDLFDLLQIKELSSKRNPSSQPQNFSQ